MNGATLSDVLLLIPELILVGMALALILVARRIRKTPVAVVGTVMAALAAALVSVWSLPDGATTGFGGMITLDGYSQFFKVLIAATLAMASLLSVRTIDGEKVARGEYHALLLLAATGMMLAASSLDLLMLYLALELMTLCSYTLVGATVENPLANEGAIKYFLLASFASALFLYGISLTYGVTGSTDFKAIASVLSEQGLGANPLLLVGVGLVTAGIAFKIAAVPFHAWAPDAYQGASAPVCGLFWPPDPRLRVWRHWDESRWSRLAPRPRSWPSSWQGSPLSLLSLGASSFCPRPT